MHDIWNPWHGCVKCSEGCEHCYMYFLDQMRDQNGRNIYRTKGGFRYPLQRDRNRHYKIKSGETIRVCMTSDFFLAEADPWRAEAWEIMRERSDVIFYLLTKRPQRVAQCLPDDWGDGWENIFFNVTCENQRRTDERMPILLSLPFKHKGVTVAPMIGPVDLDSYLASGQIEEVRCGGENYDGCRPCRYEWVKSLSDQCKKYDITFCFYETGTLFCKGSRQYHIPDKKVQSQQAFRSGLSYEGKRFAFTLTNELGWDIPKDELYVPHFHPVNCKECGSRMRCNGCSDCGKCEKQTR